MNRINKLLDLIRKKYPEERILDSMTVLANTWNRNCPNRIPFIFNSGIPGPDERKPPSMFIDKPEDVLEYELRRILDRASIKDDFIPQLSVYEQRGDAALPLAFPCVYEVFYNDVFWRRTHMQDIKEVYSLKKPDFANAPLTKTVLEYIKYFRKATGGKLPIDSCLIPGPAVMAGNIIGFEKLMMEFYDHPDEVKYLINLCTESIIEMYLLEIEAAEGFLNPMSSGETQWMCWMPIEAGVYLADDTIQPLSPEIMETFFKESYERIAKRFGGVVLHSCGNWGHIMRRLANMDSIIGFQTGINETPLDIYLEAIENKRDRMVLQLHNNCTRGVTVNGKELKRPTNREMATKILPKLAENRVLACILAATDGITVEEANEVAHIAKSTGRYRSSMI